jgi:protoporphyrinogen oxidase
MPAKTAIIIGAGPAGLTAAYELLTRTDVKPIVLEKSEYMGGIARTVNYKGNRLDIGPHRFFSKSDRVMDWWLEMIPLAASSDGGTQEITYQQKKRTVETNSEGPDPLKEDRVMLTLKRKTRIFYLRKLFDYPISLKVETLANLGMVRTMRIGCSYLKAAAMPIKPEENLEQFLINRFGKELYLTFFKDYTEKVWGIQCDKISAAWGAQRIKGLNIMKALYHAARKIVKPPTDLKQKTTETSLVEQFLFPKLGTGQMWDIVSAKVRDMGGEIITHTNVTRLNVDNKNVISVETENSQTREKRTYTGDYFFSTMPIKELVRDLSCEVPPEIKEISDGLVYRDFVQVGVLVNKMNITETAEDGKRRPITDNWIYIQESDVKVGRMQIWNNWGPSMVADPSKIWLGLEYFCNEGDAVWSLPDEKMIELAGNELEKLGIAERTEIIDALVIHMPKTYPGYFGTYDRFDELSSYIDQFENLFLVGRNGQHKYNNQDHSMLAAMVSVDNIVGGIKTKDNIWAVNTEMEYHEEKS